MNGCIYRTEENKCKKFSVGGVLSFCYLDGTCDCQISSNADRIRSMTDEELAEWMATKTSCMRCPVDLVACHNFEFSGEMSCEEILLDWLKKEVDE